MEGWRQKRIRREGGRIGWDGGEEEEKEGRVEDGGETNQVACNGGEMGGERWQEGEIGWK